MAQHDYNIANQGFPAFRTDLNNALSAIQTTNSGTSRPTGAVAGQLWLDTTSATSPTLKYYDGADDISLATIDHSANTVNWLDSTVSVTGLTTTATGTVLTLSDSANTSTVNLIIDNDKEIRFREATANGTNYISLSAPASLSADVTYTLPVAPTANNQALISSTAGAMSFTPYSLPASDGTANQILKTNGSGVLSFATPSGGGFSGATTTSSAVDITLTNTSTQVQNITMTASGKAVILPDATTLTTKGFPVFVITNQGIYPFLIQNGAGTNIATVNTNTTTTLSLLDNSTSAGVYATGTSPIFININSGTTINTGSTGASLYSSFNEFFQGLTCDKIDSTKVLVSYHKGTSNRDVYGRVITVSGQSFSVASETILYNGSSTTASNSNVRMLDSTNGLLIVDRIANAVVVPFTVSGTAITVGTTSATFGDGISGSYSGTSRTIPLTSTLGLISNRLTNAGTDWVYRTITHNGASAPTIGTASSSIVNYNYASPSMVRISDTQAFTVYTGTGVPIARVITVSGSSAPTLQTANTTSTASYPNGHNNLIANSSTDFTFFRDERSTNYTVSGNTTTHVGDRENNFYNTNLTGSLSISKIAFGDYIFEYPFYSLLPFLNKKDSGFIAPITGNSISNPYGTGLSGGLTFATELDSTTAFLVNSNGTDTIKGSVIKYVGA